MTRARTARLLTVAAAVTSLFAGSQALAVPVEDTTTFFLRSNGCGATQESGRLSTESGAPEQDTSDGCGFIGGPPLDEIFYQLDGAPFTVNDFTTENGVPLVVDASRDVSGVIATQSWTGTGGIGEVVVDIEMFGTRIGSNGRPQSVELGSGTFSTTALPTETVYEVAFTLDLPDALQGTELQSITLTYAPRGANWNAQAAKYNGSSFVDVPTIVDDGTTAETVS
ncbi:MAG TPA: hypothetical protein VNU26_03090 [Mycobacteriales bacterium]|nr:hypothetical protein [Mycobacteriales bacterium]